MSEITEIEKSVGKPVMQSVFAKTGLRLEDLSNDDYTPENIKIIIPAILSHFKHYSSAANAIVRFRSFLKRINVEDDVLIETYKPKTTDNVKMSKKEHKNKIIKNKATLPNELTRLDDVRSRVNKFINDDVPMVDEYVIADFYLMCSFPIDESLAFNISPHGKIMNCARFVDMVTSDENTERFHSFVSQETIAKYTKIYNSIENKDKNLCAEMFRDFCEDYAFNITHLREASYILVKRFRKINLIETDNEDIKDYRKRRMFTDTVYFSPVSDRLEILKARLEELTESKIAEIKKIIDGNISE
jgi:hypothetical protein